MPSLPPGEESLLVRTDFSDDEAWQSLCEAVTLPVGEFRAYVRPVSNPALAGATFQQLVEEAAGSGRNFLLVADAPAMQGDDPTIQAIDLLDEPGRAFRLVPSAAWSVENNLSLGNMGFSEFAEAVGIDGVFRGFE
jgi:hypothetical protein